MDNPSLENGGRAGKPVPCPRCESSNTKFCYFNNHNVNQPRHFCKDCQRYWTAGGSLRNVPIGAGKRKHKDLNTYPIKPDNLQNILSFHSDQGVYSPSLDSTSVFSLKHHVAHRYGDSKLAETPANMPQPSVVVESQPQILPTVTSRSHDSASYDEANVVPQTRAFACSPGSQQKLGFTDLKKQSSLSLGLNLSKEASVQEDLGKHINNHPSDLTSSENAGKQDSRASQYSTERDESTGCSSVTANLGTSGFEAAAESTNPATKAPTMPSMQQATGLLNPMTTLGASMCPPWLWPFILSGGNALSPAGMSQGDQPLAAAAMGAMASMSPLNPAFAAAMGAMASAGRLPHMDPNVMAAITASFLQIPPLWNPYVWCLPWNTAWNMTSASVNAPMDINKRPTSPNQEQGGASKLAKKEHLQQALQGADAQTTKEVNARSFPCPAGYLDAFRSKTDVSQLKPTATAQLDEHVESHQRQASPHLNPAAQARSAAFQEGN